MKRGAIAALVTAVCLLVGAASCDTADWANHACKHHGGVSRVVKVGAGYSAVCNDGTWHQ